MKTNIRITTYKDSEGTVIYKVYEYGTGTVYMVTKNKLLAEELKSMLNKEEENASKVQRII